MFFFPTVLSLSFHKAHNIVKWAILLQNALHGLFMSWVWNSKNWQLSPPTLLRSAQETKGAIGCFVFKTLTIIEKACGLLIKAPKGWSSLQITNSHNTLLSELGWNFKPKSRIPLSVNYFPHLWTSRLHPWGYIHHYFVNWWFGPVVEQWVQS